MRPEYLDERDLEGWYLTMHEDASQIKLHLEANVYIGAIDRRRPPESETTVGDLVET